MKVVHVAAGIIRRGNSEVLAVQRGYGQMRGLWEFPGGKVERGESPEDACRRELAEELGVEVDHPSACYTVEYDYPDFHLSMECFFCHIAAGEPIRSDRQLDLRWVALADLPSLTWMPADEGLVAALAAMATGRSVAEGPSDGDAAPKTASTGEEPIGNGAGPVALDAAPNTASAADTGDSTSGPGTDQEPAPGSAAPPRAKKRTAKSTKKRSSTRHAKRVKPDLLDGVDTSGLSEAEVELVRRRAAIRKSMQGNKRANTKPELLVRQRLRAAGYTGYRLQWGKAPGRPDIAFPGRKIALFINGCFWHRCPHCHPSVPKRNTEFWEAKFRRNVERDRAAVAALEDAGWTVIIIWECELKRDKIDATMERVLGQIRTAW